MAIPLGGRIVAVTDVFGALMSNRPYKSAWPAALAWAFLEQEAGTRVDPACVNACTASRGEAENIRNTFPDQLRDDASLHHRLSAAAAAEDV